MEGLGNGMVEEWFRFMSWVDVILLFKRFLDDFVFCFIRGLLDIDIYILFLGVFFFELVLVILFGFGVLVFIVVK